SWFIIHDLFTNFFKKKKKKKKKENSWSICRLWVQQSVRKREREREREREKSSNLNYAPLTLSFN
ncbi:MAG: hypothetical protein N7Q72_04865, partial [Spiroplasma sp. Tabriz.8]|nr:hypothetical protein [Spiroplasma sp. Tabriz.8]